MMTTPKARELALYSYSDPLINIKNTYFKYIINMFLFTCDIKSPISERTFKIAVPLWTNGL